MSRSGEIKGGDEMRGDEEGETKERKIKETVRKKGEEHERKGEEEKDLWPHTNAVSGFLAGPSVKIDFLICHYWILYPF